MARVRKMRRRPTRFGAKCTSWSRTTKAPQVGKTWGSVRLRLLIQGKSLIAHTANCLLTGLLKVKVNNDNGARRLLLRNSSTGKITINFNIYKSMDPSVSKNTVSFIGHEEGVTVPYRLRVKTATQADDLKKALDREIEFVKAKSSD
ncbi:hypothetical protein NM688_g1152 [Phlebia brevispora]|uniref:Uncharacterized protein n=1 Tax=Phlebia brevispora TaxID=194682 RepID=A0ACC1TC55_9APHY|nr:hypothetical protein NM688_g1152 [Phlebia brevispora]